MSLRKLTITEARDMDFQDLIETADALIEQYAKPQVETAQERMTRLEQTLEEMPDIYRWLLTLESFFDHWTDAHGQLFGMKSKEYKAMRERRDAMERAASAAKMRYESSSRQITVLLEFDPSGMPQGRK